MRIMCVSNRGADLPVECRDAPSGFDESTEFAIEPGKEYVVYGFTVFLGCIWYYLWDEKSSYYPRWNPSPLFDVTDGRLSRYWIFGYHKDSGKDLVVVSFKEWAEDPYFYDKLTDGNQLEVDTFMRFKKLMDSEFNYPGLPIAKQLEDSFVMCPNCSEAWKVDRPDETVTCPNCSARLTNPLTFP